MQCDSRTKYPVVGKALQYFFHGRHDCFIVDAVCLDCAKLDKYSKKDDIRYFDEQGSEGNINCAECGRQIKESCPDPYCSNKCHTTS